MAEVKETQETDNLNEAVTNAVKAVPNEKDEKETPVTETETETESEITEIEGDPEEINNALVLFRSLNNPAERVKLIENLAAAGGYDLTKKSEVKQLERDARAILKEKLGANYDILNGDALSDAFEELVSARVEKLTKPVLDRVTAAEVKANESLANKAMEDFFERHEITGREKEVISEKMFAKMQTMPATPKTNVTEYLDDLYTIVSKGKTETTAVKRMVVKINKNAKDSNRLSGEGTGNEDRFKEGSRMPDLDESVRAAFAGKKLN